MAFHVFDPDNRDGAKRRGRSRGARFLSSDFTTVHGGVAGVGVEKHGVFGIGVFIPAVERLDIDGRESSNV